MDSIEFHGFHWVPWVPWDSVDSLEFYGFPLSQWIAKESIDFCKICIFTHRLRILKSGYSLRAVDVVGVTVIAIIGVVSVFVYFCAVAMSCAHVFNTLPNALACRINRVCSWNGPGQPGPVA